MKIAFDISQITEHKTGIEYYASELFHAFYEEFNKKYEIFAYTNNLQNIDTKIYKNAKVIEVSSDRPNLSWIRKVSSDLKEKKIDAFVSPSYFTFSLFFPNTFQVIHDLAPIRTPENWGLKARIMYKLQLKLASFKAKAFLTNTEYTLNDVVSYLPRVKKKAFNISTGLNKWANAPKSSKIDISRVSEKYGVTKKYILSVSTLQPRKNYVNMIKAFAEVLKENSDLEYVIAGKKGWMFDEIFSVVKELGIENSVKFLGYVDEEDLPALYDGAELLLYCSTFEGFGLPALEAYSRDIPVVLSDIEVFKELLLDDGIYVNPNEIKSIQKGVHEALDSKNRKANKEILDRYTWYNVGRNLDKIILKTIQPS